MSTIPPRVLEHAYMTVTADPLGYFEPGAVYTRGEVALFLEAEDLPIGMVLQNGQAWTVDDDGERLVLRSGDTVLDAMGVRDMRGAGRCPVTNRDTIMVLLYEAQLDGRPAPTHRELARQMGVSTTTVGYHVQMLILDGYAERDGGKHRSLALTEAGWERMEKEVGE